MKWYRVPGNTHGTHAKVTPNAHEQVGAIVDEIIPQLMPSHIRLDWTSGCLANEFFGKKMLGPTKEIF